jgi:transcriptional regulator with XRE-family HTH domain
MPRSAAGTDPIDVLVGVRVKIKRKERGITQSGLAEAVGVTFQQIQKYERGVNRISAATLFKISLALRCPVTSFFCDDGLPATANDLPLPPGTAELLMAFRRLRSPKLRSRVVCLLESLADDDDDDLPDAANDEARGA